MAWPELTPAGADDRKRVVVAGAGLVGLSCALWLQRAGHEVFLADRHTPDETQAYRHSASYGNACTIAFGACLPVAMPGILGQVPGMLLDRASPLSIFWRDLPQLAPWLMSFVHASRRDQVDRIVTVLGALLRATEPGLEPLITAAGATGLLRRTGCLYLYRNETEFLQAQTGIALREREGVRMSILNAAEIQAREPHLAPLYHKGLEFLDAYSIDTPRAYALALYTLFLQQGGHFLRGEVQGATRTSEALTVLLGDRTQQADRLVIAAGAWSGRLAARVGDRVRLNTERGYHVLFPHAGTLLSAPTCYPAHGFYMTPLGEGLRVAGTVELGGLDQPARRVRTDVIARKTQTLLPDVGAATDTWLGFRPSMPDSLPVIGPSPTDPRIIHAYGHGHIGLTLSGITGRIVAHLINGQNTPIDLHPLRPNRF
ncbi:MAG: FAD-dependent oxidoreductase [Castellaniella sp.]|uniref:NAD(P)/FAD-dependent oxidoreductase n=1 Tax=Castellaniella hirudinis TaxID=1144617 RepID=A0ABV8RZJ8_9BURK